MNTRMVRVVSGETLICDIEEKGDQLILSAPMVVHMVPKGDKIGIALFPFNPFSKSLKHTIEINKNHILFDCSDCIPDEVRDEYMKMTTGLIIPKIKV